MTVRRLTILAALVLLATGAARTSERATLLQFPRLNDTFRDMAPEIAPVSTAGLTILLSSPSNSLTIRGHELELEPLGDSRHRFRGWVDFLGKADLVAKFTGAMPAGMEDQVLLPIQQLELEGEVDFKKMPGGYDITVRQLPTHAEIVMQSRLAGQLVRVCDMLTILSGGDCSGLDAAFSRVRLPLPAAGETYFVADDQLTADERQAFDDYLRVPGAAAPTTVGR